MPASLESMDPGAIDPARHALFLDFDGTIAPIVEHPDLAQPPKRWVRLVPKLRDVFGGALAIVTGRELADIDKRFPLAEPLPVGAMYGSLRRSATGIAEAAADLADQFGAMAEALAPLVARHEGLLLEAKSAGVSLHYRARPDLAALCAEAMRVAAAPFEMVEVVEAKRVFEARPLSVDKGRCIAAFLTEPPFQGRSPIFAGDDVPDEEGFRVVNARGGLSIKVGGGPTDARLSTPSSASLAGWLEALAQGGR